MVLREGGQQPPQTGDTTMNEHKDITDNTLIEGLSYSDTSLPEPLDHWSLDDLRDIFSDVLPSGRNVS
jgi:hypothetical protein